MASRTVAAPTDTLPAADQGLLRLLEALRGEGYGFVTVSPSTHARVNARPENVQAHDLAGVFGWSRPFAAGLLPDAILSAMHEADVIAPEAGGLLRSRVRVSSLAGHLFLHSAFPTIEPDSVFFGPDTYRFARAVRDGIQKRVAPIRRAIDIGCGAGPGAVLVSDAAPLADVVMADINGAALGLAGVNAAFAGARHASVCRSDLFDEVEGDFDLIVSNPPYLNDPLQRAYRHGGGRSGEALSLRILDTSLGRLAPGGTLVLYTGVAIVDGEDLFRTIAAERLAPAEVAWSYEEVDPDVFGDELETSAYAHADRIAAVVVTVTKEA